MLKFCLGRWIFILSAVWTSHCPLLVQGECSTLRKGVGAHSLASFRSRLIACLEAIDFAVNVECGWTWNIESAHRRKEQEVHQPISIMPLRRERPARSRSLASTQCPLLRRPLGTSYLRPIYLQIDSWLHIEKPGSPNADLHTISSRHFTDFAIQSMTYKQGILHSGITYLST